MQPKDAGAGHGGGPERLLPRGLTHLQTSAEGVGVSRCVPSPAHAAGVSHGVPSLPHAARVSSGVPFPAHAPGVSRCVPSPAHTAGSVPSSTHGAGCADRWSPHRSQAGGNRCPAVLSFLEDCILFLHAPASVLEWALLCASSCARYHTRRISGYRAGILAHASLQDIVKVKTT